MDDDTDGRGFSVATFLLFIAFVFCIVMALHASRRFMENHRPQSHVVEIAPKISDVRAVEPKPGQGEITPAPTESYDERQAEDLKPSLDLPQESSDVPTPDTQAEAAQEQPADQDSQPRGDDGYVAGRINHHHRAQRGFLHHHRHRRHHLRDSANSCEPLCGFFKDTAEAAGLIK